MLNSIWFILRSGNLATTVIDLYTLGQMVSPDSTPNDNDICPIAAYTVVFGETVKKAVQKYFNFTFEQFLLL